MAGMAIFRDPLYSIPFPAAGKFICMTEYRGNKFPLLVGDVGGTNARFGLIREEHGQPQDVRGYPCARFPGLVDAVQEYLGGIAGARPHRAGFAVATSVGGDQVQMTNHVWRFSIEESRRALGLEQLLVVNDFTALAMALPALDPSDLRAVGGSAAVPGTPVALLGPGTGLGVSGLIPAGDGWIPLEGEGGHVTFAPADRQELELVRVLQRRFDHLSAERLLSGPGLVNLYRAHATLQGVQAQPVTPAEVSGNALSGECALCRAALDSFCAMLGTIAGNLALTLGARGGLYIGGGIVPRLGGYFRESMFRSRFEQKGRFSAYLEEIPVWVIMARYPTLIGMARLLQQRDVEGRR